MHVRTLLLAPLLGGLVAVRAPERPSAPPAGPVDSLAVVRLLQRATWGARPEDIARARELGVDAWLEEQLHPERLDDPVQEEVARRFPAAVQSIDELLERFPPPDPQARPADRPNPDSLSVEERQRMRRERAARSPARILGELAGARLLRAAWSERQLEEVMTAFWFDHFNVFFGKGADRWLVGDFERSAIRPYVFGTFEDMLVATARHPAMLFYLDNWRSASVDTARILRAVRGRPAEQRVRETLLSRLPGINENYARELMELHTLGVDGGYTQADVIQVARAFTGWTFTPPGGRDPGMAMARRLGVRAAPPPDGPYRFWFRPELHDRGPKVVLGTTLPGGRGEEDGLAVLRMLAHHPSTARHIARELATRFVSDEPPESLVDRLAQVFLDSDGDLREVTRTLFSSPELQDAPPRMKSPFALVAGTLRLTRADVGNPGTLVEALRSLGEAPYLAEAPTGYPEAASSWTSGGGVLDRVEFATRFASGQLPGVRPDGAALRRDARAADTDPVRGLVRVLLPGADPETVVPELRDALEAEEAGSEGGGARLLALILASPEFQRQ